MATRAAERPAGKVSEGRATAQRASAERFAFAVVDGSSLSLTDRAMSKGFGSVGALAQRGWV